ncbi:hypothetical protein BHE74_00045943, partial [Ensete ventricosum]
KKVAKTPKGFRRLRPSAKNIPVITTFLTVTCWIKIVEGGWRRIGIKKGRGNKFAEVLLILPLLRTPSLSFFDASLTASPQLGRNQADTARWLISFGPQKNMHRDEKGFSVISLTFRIIIALLGSRHMSWSASDDTTCLFFFEAFGSRMGYRPKETLPLTPLNSVLQQ